MIENKKYIFPVDVFVPLVLEPCCCNKVLVIQKRLLQTHYVTSGITVALYKIDADAPTREAKWLQCTNPRLKSNAVPASDLELLVIRTIDCLPRQRSDIFKQTQIRIRSTLLFLTCGRRLWSVALLYHVVRTLSPHKGESLRISSRSLLATKSCNQGKAEFSVTPWPPRGIVRAHWKIYCRNFWCSPPSEWRLCLWDRAVPATEANSSCPGTNLGYSFPPNKCGSFSWTYLRFWTLRCNPLLVAIAVIIPFILFSLISWVVSFNIVFFRFARCPTQYRSMLSTKKRVTHSSSIEHICVKSRWSISRFFRGCTRCVDSGLRSNGPLIGANFMRRPFQRRSRPSAVFNNWKVIPAVSQDFQFSTVSTEALEESVDLRLLAVEGLLHLIALLVQAVGKSREQKRFPLVFHARHTFRISAPSFCHDQWESTNQGCTEKYYPESIKIFLYSGIYSATASVEMSTHVLRGSWLVVQTSLSNSHGWRSINRLGKWEINLFLSVVDYRPFMPEIMCVIYCHFRLWGKLFILTYLLTLL